MRAFALTMFLAIPVGLPALCMVVVARSRRRGGGAEPATPFAALYAHYRDAYWWMEAWDMARRLLLTCATLTFTNSGTLVLFSALLCMFSVWFHDFEGSRGGATPPGSSSIGRICCARW